MTCKKEKENIVFIWRNDYILDLVKKFQIQSQRQEGPISLSVSGSSPGQPPHIQAYIVLRSSVHFFPERIEFMYLPETQTR